METRFTAQDGAADRRATASRPSILHLFDRFATVVTRWTGSPLAFSLALTAVLAWAATGPLFGFSETWQLLINTGTTIITFLMVFLIQQSQNKDSEALHLKLNELLASQENASNKLVDIEELDQEQLHQLAIHYRRLAEQSRRGKQDRDECENQWID